jgi:hypothetical protein
MKHIVLVFLLFISVHGMSAENSCDILFYQPPKFTKLSKEEVEQARKNWDRDKDFVIIPSGRDPEVIKIYEAVSIELYKPGGLLDKLKIPRTQQIIEFLKGQDLNAVAKAGTGGFPISHYLDGAQVLRAYQDRRSLIYEVVYPGPSQQHAFYRDDNPPEQQISILLHVIGHNHFAHSSMLKGYRIANGPEVSRHLDALMNRLYETENKDEVQRWYLFLQSLTGLQDFASGYYEEISSFLPKPPSKTSMNGQHVYENKHPKAATANVFQAFVANLPANIEPWKREIAEDLVKMTAFQTALTQTQIMNEGWATFLQRMLIRHLKQFNTLSHWMNAFTVMNPEDTVNLSDPYWLGVQAWDRMYEKYLARSDVQAMKTNLEKDAGFIAYAESLISSMDDAAFLKLGLDHEWMMKKKLAIVKMDENPDAIDPNKLPPKPKTEEEVAPWQILSRDPEVLLRSILKENLYVKYWMRPHIELLNFQRKGTGEVELSVRDQFGSQVPLHLGSLAQTLYVYSQIMRRSISLEFSMVDPAAAQKKEPPRMMPPWMNQDPSPPKKKELPPLIRVRISISPQGNVNFFKLNSVARSEVAIPEMAHQFSILLERYIEDLYLEDTAKFKQVLEDNPQLEKIAGQYVRQITDGVDVMNFYDHVPQAARAMKELESMMSRRTLKALERAAQGKGGLVRGSSGQMYLKALPSTPRISFDQNYIQEHFDLITAGKMKKSSNKVLFVTEIESADFTSMKKHRPGELNFNSSVHPIGGGEGDYVWGPGRPNGGGGKGKKPGDDPEDPSWVPIPEDLYARFLGERVKMPKLNPKVGAAHDRRKVLQGERRRRSGQAVMNSIARNIVNKGLSIMDGKDLDPLDDIMSSYEEGMIVFQPSKDWVVKAEKERRKPNKQVVILYLMDASYSTHELIPQFKRLAFDLDVLAKQNYGTTVNEYVAFDTQAHVLKNQEEFFKFRLGGGTRHQSGNDKALEILDAKYPRSQWDRFVILLGDLEEPAQSALPSIEKLAENVEFYGIAHAGNPSFDLVPAVRSKAEETKGFGYVYMGEQGHYTMEHLRTLFKNQDAD